MYVIFSGWSWLILGRTTAASDEVLVEAEVVHSLRMVEVCAMQPLCEGRVPCQRHFLAHRPPSRHRSMDRPIDFGVCSWGSEHVRLTSTAESLGSMRTPWWRPLSARSE